MSHERAGAPARHAAVLAALPAAVVVLDRDARVVLWNRAAEGLLGWSEDEVLGGHPPFVPEDRAEAFRKRHEEAFTADVIPAIVVGRRRKDGTMRDIRVERAPLCDDAGRVTALVGVLSDVTEELRAREEQLRKETNFRALIERAPDAIVVHRLGFVVYVNPKTVSLLGYACAEDLVGRRMLSLLHPDDHAPALARTQAIVERREESPPREERAVRRDGTYVDIEVIGLPILFDGQPATLAHARDITERKRLVTQLRMADRLAWVGRLAAGVGHEINNPLTYVLGNLDLAERRLGGLAPEARVDELRQLLADVRHGAERVRRIARDLAVLSRSESDERAPVDVGRVLDTCAAMAAHEVRDRARLVKRYADVPLVSSNEPRLAQVFLNLIINAAQAIAPGRADANAITLSATSTPSDVEVTVEDTGEGMAPAVLERVFDPFFTTKPIGVGTGLGLSICQGIVAALGGTIALESEPGRGTRARVTLPVHSGPSGVARSTSTT